MERILLILLGIFLCYMAVLDYKGSTIHVKPVFRNMPELKDLQRTNSVYEMVIGVCVILFALLAQYGIIALVVGGVMLVTCVMMAHHNQVMARMKMDYLKELKQDAAVKARRAAAQAAQDDEADADEESGEEAYEEEDDEEIEEGNGETGGDNGETGKGAQE